MISVPQVANLKSFANDVEVGRVEFEEIDFELVCDHVHLSQSIAGPVNEIGKNVFIFAVYVHRPEYT